VRPFKGIFCDDISEFESYMPSHAVRSLWAFTDPDPALCIGIQVRAARRNSGVVHRSYLRLPNTCSTAFMTGTLKFFSSLQ
jgi:hypothetical protein